MAQRPKKVKQNNAAYRSVGTGSFFTMVDWEAMQLVTLALERAIVWPVTGGEFSRKLARVLSGTKSFQLHMERQFALEELDGYYGWRLPGLSGIYVNTCQ